MTSPAASAARTDVRFPSGETTCAAWLYAPAGGGDAPRPAVVLGHGLGAVKEMGLDAYARRFAAAGYVALAFDYRHFGESGGEPRQLLDPARQLDDWAAALAYVRGLPQVDADRVAIFGSSFGGGHAIVMAARDPRVAAAIAQCPFTLGIRSAMTIDPKGTVGVTVRALRDVAARVLGRPPVQVALAGAPGTPALMNAPDALAGYTALMPDDREVAGEVAARVALQIPLMRPGAKAKDVRCPILFCVCDKDTVAPVGSTLKYAAQAPRGEVVRYPVGHFDIYLGEPFERAVADQVAFLQRHVPVAAG
ncbi:MAG: alpha/beta hydrolase [Baekduiaceae bacterium]